MYFSLKNAKHFRYFNDLRRISCDGHKGCLKAIFNIDKPEKNLKREPKEFIVDIEHMILHPDYDPYDNFVKNDIALLKLTHPVNSTIAKPISEKVSLNPITASDVHYALAAGWGEDGTGRINYDLNMINVDMENCTGQLQSISATGGVVCATCHVRQKKSKFLRLLL